MSQFLSLFQLKVHYKQTDVIRLSQHSTITYTQSGSISVPVSIAGGYAVQEDPGSWSGSSAQDFDNQKTEKNCKIN